MYSLITTDVFNTVEGLFWILLGCIAVAAYKYTPAQYSHWALFSAVILITFGLSDFAQAYFGSFLVPGNEWLLVWKAIDVIGLVVAAVWYMRLRVTKY